MTKTNSTAPSPYGWIIAASVISIMIYFFKGILAPFIVGIILAYILNPLVDKTQALVKSRIFSVLIVLTILLTALIGILLGVVPIIKSQLVKLITALPNLQANLVSTLLPFGENIAELIPGYNMEAFKTAMSEHVGTVGSWMASFAGSFLSNSLAIATFFGYAAIVPLVAYFVLVDWHSIVSMISSWLPKRYEETIREQCALIDLSLKGYIQASFTVVSVAIIYFSISLSIVGLEFSVILGILSGIFAFIPVIYAVIGFSLSMLVALGQFTTMAPFIAIAVIFYAFQTFESSLLTPKLMDKHVGLHPLWVIFALMAGLNVAGFTGIVIAVPAAAILAVIFRFVLKCYLNSPYYLNK